MPSIASTRERQADVIERRARSLVAQAAAFAAAGARAEAEGRDGSADWDAVERILARGMVIFALLGIAAERRLLRRVARVAPARNEPVRPAEVASFAEAATDVHGFTSAPFLEAVNVFARAVPDLHKRVQRLMSMMGPAAAVVRQSERTRAVEALQTAAKRHAAQVKGTPRTMAEGRRLAVAAAAGVDVSADRMSTTFRTALSEAFNAGAYAQLQTVQDIVPLYELVEIHDLRTRGNPRGLYPEPHRHWQMNGFIAEASDPIWKSVWPPNGYNCRATVIGITIEEGKRRGLIGADGRVHTARLAQLMRGRRRLIDSGQYPDPGFKANTAVAGGLL